VLIAGLGLAIDEIKVAVPSDAAGEHHVLFHHGLSLGVDCTEVGVLEETDDVSLGSLLKSLDSLGLET
jgi:hypothetical protein